jgi:hypothetical protein
VAVAGGISQDLVIGAGEPGWQSGVAGEDLRGGGAVAAAAGGQELIGA